MAEDTKYRLLGKDEWDKITSIFERHGSKAPASDFSSIAVAERNGEIVGFLVLQLIPHMEPIWIDPENGAGVNFMRLEATLEDQVPVGTSVYAFAPNARIAAMAENCGFVEAPYRPMVKEVK